MERQGFIREGQFLVLDKSLGFIYNKSQNRNKKRKEKKLWKIKNKEHY